MQQVRGLQEPSAVKWDWGGQGFGPREDPITDQRQQAMEMQADFTPVEHLSACVQS